jgi:hypothetical protein
MRLLRGANFPPHSAISGTGRRLAVLAVRAGTGLKRIRDGLARRGRAHDAINGLLPGAEKMSHSAAKAMTWRDAAVRRRKSATSIASSCAC